MSKTINVPQKLTVSGTPEASQGVSMEAMIQAAVLKALAGMGGTAPVAATPVVASGVSGASVAVATKPVNLNIARMNAAKAAKKAAVAGVAAGLRSPASVSSRIAGVAPKAEGFDARQYFSLGESYVELADGAYIAESMDEMYAKNPFAVVGIQRKAIMLSEPNLRRLYALLKAVCE